MSLSSIINPFLSRHTTAGDVSLWEKFHYATEIRALAHIQVEHEQFCEEVFARFTSISPFPFPHLRLIIETAPQSRATGTTPRGKANVEFLLLSRRHQFQSRILWATRKTLIMAVPDLLTAEQRRESTRFNLAEDFRIHCHFGDFRTELQTHLNQRQEDWYPHVVNISQNGFAVEIPLVKKSFVPIVGQVYNGITLDFSSVASPAALSPPCRVVLRNVIIREVDQARWGQISVHRQRTITLGFQFLQPTHEFADYMKSKVELIRNEIKQKGSSS